MIDGDLDLDLETDLDLDLGLIMVLPLFSTITSMVIFCQREKEEKEKAFCDTLLSKKSENDNLLHGLFSERMKFIVGTIVGTNHFSC